MKTVMENFWRAVTGTGVHGEWLAIKSAVILALALVVMRLWRRGSASARHWVWAAVFGCLLCLPALERLAPTWHAPAWVTVAGLTLNEPQAISATAPAPTGADTMAATPASGDMAKVTGVKAAQASTVQKAAVLRAMPWGRVAIVVWLAGVFFFGSYWLMGQARLWWVSRQWKAWKNPAAVAILEELRAEYGIGRPVKLLVAEAVLTPVTWGGLRPVVAVAESAEQWPEERLRVVLRHELAHVKRWDWPVQELSRVVCGVYWFNPLVWLAARRMRAEREAACDDLVLNAGAAPTEYAGHLVEIARQFALRSQLGGVVAMARASGLEQRVTAILDGQRNRRPMAALRMALMAVAVLGSGVMIGSYGQGTDVVETGNPSNWSGVSAGVASHLKEFVAAKAAQAAELERADEKERLASNQPSQHNLKQPDLQPFFAAAVNGDWATVTNTFAELRAGIDGGNPPTNRIYYHGKYMAPVLETYGAVEAFSANAGTAKYAEIFGNEILRSMPSGSIYFGGTDAGRFTVTAMSASQIKGEPIFTLTQNALADGTYDDYLKTMYGSQIRLLSPEDDLKAFQDYMTDVKVRHDRHELKPGEGYQEDGSGRAQISGVVAVMQINGLLVKDIFDWNTNRDFYVEQSYPLDWMYPHFEPHGLIFKLDREPVVTISEAMVKENNDYWAAIVAGMIGDWLNEQTPVASVVEFGRTVFDEHDLGDFKGDPDFVQSKYASKSFAKLRESQAGWYVWRMNHTDDEVEKDRMARAADLAFRQALALYPHSSETVENYTNFLMSVDRAADAALVAQLKPVALQMRLVDDTPSVGNEMLTLKSYSPAGGATREDFYVSRRVLLDQTDVASASAEEGPQGGWQIDLTFTEAGKKKFAEVTQANANHQLAILLNGTVWSAPYIRTPITEGKAQITGSFSEAEAKELADKLNWK